MLVYLFRKLVYIILVKNSLNVAKGFVWIKIGRKI
jgi:hypothetical protein